MNLSIIFICIIIIISIISYIIWHSYTTYVYRDYKSLIYDTLRTSKGHRVGIFKNIKQLYIDHPEIFIISKRINHTLQTNLQCQEYDCYFNPYYTIIDGYTIYLHRKEYVKYLLWIHYVTRKHWRKK